MIRINTGILKGRNIAVPKKAQVRPITSMMRETFFNLVGLDLNGLVMLDLFAGSGVMGFEAISNGIDKCYFIDNSGLMIDFLYKNTMSLEVKDKVEIIKKNAFTYLKNYNSDEPFDIIFADPPYEKFEYPRLIKEIFASTAQGKKTRVFLKVPGFALKQLKDFRFRRYGSGDVNLLKFL